MSMQGGSAMRGIRLLIAMVRADVYGSGAFGPEVAGAARVLTASGRVTLWAVGGAGLGLTAGFVGFRRLAPEAQNGRLVGIIITGLLGLSGGLAWGLWRERRRPAARDAA
jgi:hypothetical protein